jgi:aryl-alcohol dehydrogenase-like predicted oxidoreductase
MLLSLLAPDLSMNTVELPGTGRHTSQLAIGSGRLMGATSLRDSLGLLEAAFDAGIRHVDTAPSYGIGEAERCVGEFLNRHQGEITVTTKYGIPPPKNQRLMGMARAVAKPLMARIPGMKDRLRSVAAAATKNDAVVSYTVEGAQASLENSLRALKVDRIDLWLLHEASAEDLQDERLLRFLEASVEAGKIGSFGVGSEAEKIPGMYAERREYCPVIQCEWDPLAPVDQWADRFQVHHRVLQNWLPRLSAHLQNDVELCRAWSRETGADLASPGMLATLLMKAALLGNPKGITLFFSKKKEHIAENARIAADDSLARPAGILHTIMRREGRPMAAANS